MHNKKMIFNSLVFYRNTQKHTEKPNEFQDECKPYASPSSIPTKKALKLQSKSEESAPRTFKYTQKFI